MKKIIVLLSAAVIFVSCSKAEQVAVLKDIPVTSAVQPFGPFFLPENHSLSSVSLNYVTGTPQKTTVYFTMVGELDWARNDPSQTRYHRMVFKDLEESAVYQFTIPCEEKEIAHSSAIQTVPFGDEYQFQFAVAPMERDLESGTQPHFLVLSSEKEQVSESEFYAFYNRNRKLLASTILIPMFGLNLQGTNYDLAAGSDGFHFVRYKNLCLTLVTREMPSFDFLTRYLSSSPDDQNVIVLSHVGKNTVTDLSQRLALMNCRIYVFNRGWRPGPELENVTPVEAYQMVDISKKRSYALVMTNPAR
jgi:hypothetical protein